MTKITRGQKGEQMVIEELNNLKDYHHLLNNITFTNKKSEMTHQIDHILIHPRGVFVIETKNYYGEISYNDITQEWFKKVDDKIIKIASPIKQNVGHAVTLFHVLNEKYKILPVEVFIQNNAPYFPDDNVINLKDLLLFINSHPTHKKLKEDEMDRIKKLILKKASQISNQEHVTNIKILKQIRQESQDEMSYAIESGLCPRCQYKLIKKGYLFYCYKCGYKFSL